MSKQTSNALEIVDRMIGDDSGLRVLIEGERVNAEVAREIHHLRNAGCGGVVCEPPRRSSQPGMVPTRSAV